MSPHRFLLAIEECLFARRTARVLKFFRARNSHKFAEYKAAVKYLCRG